jgi:hypothetical protein
LIVGVLKQYIVFCRTFRNPSPDDFVPRDDLPAWGNNPMIRCRRVAAAAGTDETDVFAGQS